MSLKPDKIMTVSNPPEKDGKRFLYFNTALIGYINGDKITFVRQWFEPAKIEVEVRDK